ncbi:putative integral membrane protein [Fulvivirga imtechensis AK7]|uniref:Putative integral membrane protein n=1 Tax=Fulvivirga imtechensis AK7 TaxID=1237149 RepID=L8JTZ9_9BACT|nr:saccharopine dehydrogenase NADP-binding domain-containing protein [Fulvivirga imtechensis]ELR71024.1 putative integral membrane protein [Fulvivirga imtechensis AK7]
MSDVLIYGAYGYTGELIAREAKRKGLKAILSGRNLKKLEKIAHETGYPFHAVDLNDRHRLVDLLSRVKVVIHCAGPFKYTARQMIHSCLEAKTHYLDITGEYQVFEMAHAYGDEARRKKVMLLPGSGFDVVPSDCLAAHLKSFVPRANNLELAFTSTSGFSSRGTAKTAIEGSGEGQIVRKEHQLKSYPLGQRVKKINYGPFEKISMGISWGDVASAYFSTGIPNIEVYIGATPKQVRLFKWMHRLRFLVRMKWVKNYLKKQADKKPAGPSEVRRQKSQMYLWGKAEQDGQSKELRLITPNGYTLTYKTAVLFAEKILQGEFTPGYQTPSTAFGKDVILEIDGCSFI